tara:strand:+ start:633 stop:896 length:264 start_codon:yes stop_codon:yes gene_type:complete
MATIGSIEGYPIIYDDKNDTVFCKNTTVKAQAIIRAYQSSVDRESIQSELVMRKFQGGITLGCFDIDNVTSKSLIKLLKHARIKKQN